jgi:hypothetical protein
MDVVKNSRQSSIHIPHFKMIKNKKSSVPVTILVVGVFVLCAFALYTFFVSEFKSSNSFVVIDFIRQANFQTDEFLYYLNSGVNEDKAMSYFPSISKIEGGYMYGYSFDENTFQISFKGFTKQVRLFEIRYTFAKS